METLGGIALILILVAVIAGCTGCIAWLVSDAQRRGQSGGLNAALFLVLGPFVAFAVHAIRQGPRLTELTPEDYTEPDDALKAAAMLESLGEWDEALALLQSIISRWPMHAQYASKCVESIQLKQSLGQ